MSLFSRCERITAQSTMIVNKKNLIIEVVDLIIKITFDFNYMAINNRSRNSVLTNF
jgi:hypothetical protein